MILNKHKPLLFLIICAVVLGFLWFFWPSATQTAPLVSETNQIPSSDQKGERRQSPAKTSDNEGGTSREEARLQDQQNQTSTSKETLSGQVVDPTFQAIAKATISWIGGPSPTQINRVVAGADGHFKIPKPAYLPKSIFVSAPGFVARNLDFPTEDLSNTIVLQPGGQLDISVVDEEGKPIANASVFSRANGEQSTNEDGQLSLTQLTDPARLTVKAEGFNTSTYSIPLEAGFWEIRLLRNGFLHGRVVDDKRGIPIEKFQIKVRVPMPDMPTHHFESEDGKFEIKDLSRRQMRFIVSATGYISKALTITEILPKSKSEPIEIRLSNEGIYFSGFVTNIFGSPIAEATVTALIGDEGNRNGVGPMYLPKRENGQWIIFGKWIDAISTQANQKGYFEIGPLPDGHQLGLLAIAPGFAPGKIQYPETLVEEERKNLQIKLKNYGILEGEAGQSEHARSISYRDSEQQYHEITLEPGEDQFIFEDVVPGRTTVNMNAATGTHLSSGEISPIVPDEQEVVILPGIAKQIQIGFVDRYRMSGQILIDGAPMDRALIIVEQKEPPQRHFRSHTDEQGYFDFYPLSPGNYELMANGSRQHTIFGAKNRKMISIEADQTDLLLEFTSPGNVYGSVVDQSAGTLLTMKIECLIGENSYVNTNKTIRIQADGNFEFFRIPGGKFEILLNHLSSSPIILVPEMVMPDDGSDINLGVLGEAKGQLQISIQAPDEFMDMETSFYKKSPGEKGTQGDYFTYVSATHSPKILRGLTPGTTIITADQNSGFRILPKEITVVIDEKRPARADFLLMPETNLYILTENGSSDLHFKKVLLKEEATGRTWNVPFHTPSQVSNNRNAEVELYYTRRHLVARGIPAGFWEINIENQKGKLATRRVRLLPGKAVTMPIGRDAFIAPKKIN